MIRRARTLHHGRHLGIDPFAYLRDVLSRLPARPPDADLSDLLPDRWRPAELVPPVCPTVRDR